MAEIVNLNRQVRLARYRARTRRQHGFGITLLVVGAFFAATAVGALVLPHILPEAATAGVSAAVSRILPLCEASRGRNCIIDGDTFRLDDQSIRIADIDTPETHKAQCAAEKALSDRATARMLELLNAGPFALEPLDRDEDRYGRKLRVVTLDGRSLGQVLVAEGLARSWDGARHPWC